MAESEDEDSSLNLTGFLFGNINEKGELEDTEILDEVICSIEWFTSVIALRKMGLYWMQTFVNKCPLQESFTELINLFMALAFYLFSNSARSTARRNLNNLIVETDRC